ncbi:heterokaryon incompatibility protein-domain-containing protein [Pseudoneurospora amorphoporcata]|uniref:Heterokaryon incompatibility protein-domain-containing protein n=1 Tax=Pseudoneurospora amorphoporcata TaxID=241081 RepID=A0AAN6NL37_9PEZI|nr:heterokaryon incompatibility protein-domain-containing protein [Pseudoneurospora amorphoporcata]
MASPDDPTMTSRYASRQLNNLCDACQGVFPTEGPWFCNQEGARLTDEGDPRWHLRDFTIRDLHESAEAGCHLCRVFLDSLLPLDFIVGKRQGYSQWYHVHKDIQLECTLEREWDAKEFPMRLYIPSIRTYQNTFGREFAANFASLGRRRGRAFQPLRFHRVHPTPLDNSSDRTAWVTYSGFDTWQDPSLSGRPFTIVQPSSATNFDASAFAQVRRWLMECLESHDECSNWKPTLMETYDYQRKIRLVDVGTDKCPFLRLVDGESLLSGTGGITYITLSYRWTAETELTSMKSYNKARYQDLIPTDTLPQVYKDAAAFARAFGVRYVWIDSLCIIQDSPTDWNEQSSMMDQIYTHGVLNLSAMFGERALGLQVGRDPLGISPCILSRRLSTNPENGEELYEHWACFEGYGANSFVYLAPLFKRGWCLQEKVLPIRNVYLGEQLIWQCQRNMATESFPSWICRSSSGLKRDTLMHAERQHTSIWKFRSTDGNTAARSPDEVWEEIAMIYSGTEVTKQMDRLAALRGILNRMAAFFNKELEPDWCIAGLWKTCLVRHLLWRRHGAINQSDSQMVARAKELLEIFPSRSWASCATNIRFLAPLGGENVRVDDLVHIESIQPGQSLGPEATYTAFETCSRIVLRGRVDAKFNPERVARKWVIDGNPSMGQEAFIAPDGERAYQFHI